MWCSRRAQHSKLSNQQDLFPLWSQRTRRPGPCISPLRERYVGTEPWTRIVPLGTFVVAAVRGWTSATAAARRATPQLSVHLHSASIVVADLVQECPTIWRIYDYATPEERDAMLQAHSSGRDMPMGAGGEAYIATDDWCHYCGECGHLGDVSLYAVIFLENCH
jgi:hypothetical protein